MTFSRAIYEDRIDDDDDYFHNFYESPTIALAPKSVAPDDEEESEFDHLGDRNKDVGEHGDDVWHLAQSVEQTVYVRRSSKPLLAI